MSVLVTITHLEANTGVLNSKVTSSTLNASRLFLLIDKDSVPLFSLSLSLCLFVYLLTYQDKWKEKKTDLEIGAHKAKIKLSRNHNNNRNKSQVVGLFGHSRLSSLSHCGLILKQKSGISVRELIPTLKKRKKPPAPPTTTTTGYLASFQQQGFNWGQTTSAYSPTTFQSPLISLAFTQEISIAHNHQLKARAQCADRKMLNLYITKQQQTTQKYINDHTIDNHTIYKEKRAQNNRKKGGKALRLLTVPSIHKHINK